MDRPLYCLKGPNGLCWWTVAATPAEAWSSGYPQSSAERADSYMDRLKRIQNSLLIDCVCVTLAEAK